MLELMSPESGRPVAPRPPEGPEAMQAFVARHRPFFILIALLAAQFLLLSFQITRNSNVRLIKVWAADALDPFERSLRGVADGATLSWRVTGGLWHAQKQNEELNVKLVTAESQIQQLSEQAAETQRLRALLDFKSHLPFQTVAAEVIASSPGENSNAVFIGKGADSGLTTDLAVITPEGVAGKLIAVFPHTAQVLLITDPSSGVGSLFQSTRVQGVLKGEGNGLCRLDYVMNEEKVAAGETVLTSGLDQIFPKGLPLGTVVNVGDGNIYKNVAVKPAAALDRLEDVLVVLKPVPNQQEARNALNH